MRDAEDSAPEKLVRSGSLTRRQFIAVGVGIFFLLLGSYLLMVWRRYQLRMGYDWARIGDYVTAHARELTAWSRHAHLSPEERIREQFGYLRLEDGAIEAFVRDYQRHEGSLGRFVPPRNAQDVFFNRFLLSTDFFRNGADESRLVRYVRFYDPYVNPCWNPCLPVAA